MKKIITNCLVYLLFLVLFHHGPFLDGCTTFCLKDGKHLIFGRNYDWMIGTGLVIVNKRNLIKRADVDPPENPVQWISKYGSITFNQYGKEYPTGGMNETGLVVEQMMLPKTRYSPPDERLAIRELAWIQYQLDNFQSVKEVIESVSILRIVADSIPLHFLISDRSGQVASIEFLDGKTVYHSAEDLPVEVLANSTYAESLRYLKKHKGFGGTDEIPSSISSLDRFVRAANMVQQYSGSQADNSVDYAFEILASVSQKKGTKWSIVYDVKNLAIHFKTSRTPLIKTVNLKDFDFSCDWPSKVIDIDINKAGNVSSYFVEYSTEINRKLIGESFKNTQFLKNIPEEVLDQIAAFPEKIHCKSQKK
ncbi:linear amide C-N hydrolase [Acidobacteriota bacterium]